jgi:cytochrome c peroxidase
MFKSLVTSLLLPLSTWIALLMLPALAAAQPHETAVSLGERLFLETRFAEYFKSHSGGRINPPVGEHPADPVLSRAPRGDGTWISGPTAGQTMSCASCHLVDQADSIPGGGPRAYSDFSIRSPIPLREDGLTHTPRNSPALIDILVREDADGRSLTHFDGEFGSIEDLVLGGFLGRNFGWLTSERSAALAHLARVIREDAGDPAHEDPLFQAPYSDLLRGEGAARDLPESLRLDSSRASDDAIALRVARLVGDYLRSLQYSRDEEDQHNGSPYDAFLTANALPRAPGSGESDLAYARRLRKEIESLQNPNYINQDIPQAPRMKRHEQAFTFGPEELQGMKVFFSEPGRLDARGRPAAGTGNCIACHAPPHFSDFRFHAIGTSQFEYDLLHGHGAYRSLLDSTPKWQAPAAPAADTPEAWDAGAWHTLARSPLPPSTPLLEETLCQQLREESGSPRLPCQPDHLKNAAFGRFKTPLLRNLGQSAPYFHSGTQPDLRNTIFHYMRASAWARARDLVNAPPAVSDIRLRGPDVVPLVKFLESLNEDYD